MQATFWSYIESLSKAEPGQLQFGQCEEQFIYLYIYSPAIEESSNRMEGSYEGP
jgi:hypothetical protein